MRIFVNDIPFDLISYGELNSSKKYETVFQKTDDLGPNPSWIDDVLVHEPTHDKIIKILYILRNRKLKDLDSITLVSKDKNALKKFVKSRFSIIKASGGVAIKKDRFLLIFRLGKWDFPKGKFEKGEAPKECAVREVEEECAVKVKANGLICKTWHTYTQNRKSILKKTYWYSMECLDDSRMTPQAEEGIEDIGWFYESDAKVALVNSYPSMRYLFKQFLEKTHKTSNVVR